MSKKVDPNKYIQEYFKENEWTALKEQEKKKYAYSKRNFNLIQSARKKVESSKFKWFGEEEPPRKKVRFSDKSEFLDDGVKEESLSPLIENETENESDAFSNCRKLAKVLFKSAKKNRNLIETSLATLGAESSDIEDTSGPRIKRCYPRRTLKPQTSYKEENLTSEDEYLYCDDCEKDYKGTCPDHGPMVHACDKQVESDVEKATGTLPDFLSIGLSSMPKAGLGVWTEVPLPKRVVFGPYLGHITTNRKEAQNSGYAWQVLKGRKPLHFVEAAQTSESNWLRFVNCATTEDKQNLTAFQYRKQIYYKTYKPVLPYTELLVWYGDNYAQDLGIDTSNKAPELLGEIDGHQCKECSALFSTKVALTRHMKRHSNKTLNPKHKCPQCSYTTGNNAELRNHLTSHSDSTRKYVCTTCGKSFKVSADLKRHLRTHSDKKPYICDVCGKAFVGSSDLVKHQRIHTGEKPYRCTTCGRDFKQVIHLRRHERSHVDQRPYKCPQCDYRAIRRISLKSHIVYKHTRKFKYNCQYCAKGFVQLKALDTHIEYRHFDTDEYREMVTKRFLEGKQVLQARGFGNLLIDENSIMTEDFGHRKETKFLSVKVEPDNNDMSSPSIYPMIVDEPGGSSGIHTLEDLRKHIEKLSIEGSVKSEVGDTESDGIQKKLKISFLFRRDQYLEATQMSNLDVLGNFKRM